MTSNVANPFAGLLPGTNLNGATVQRQQLLKPFPQFTSVMEQGRNDGSSFYHTLQVRLEKRFSHGLQFLVNYGWSKLLEKRSFLNAADPLPEKRVAAEDRPQRLVLSLVQELPFGRGKLLAGGAGPIMNRIIGGWFVNAIGTFQSGAPLDWPNAIYYGGDLQMDGHNVDRAFDITRFNRIPAEQLDWNRRTFSSRFADLRADSINSLALSAVKEVPIRETLKAQFRAEFFNAFNHPIFNAPQLSPTNTNFGRITGQSNLPRRVQLAIRVAW
jgi:hypothetical protein